MKKVNLINKINIIERLIKKEKNKLKTKFILILIIVKFKLNY